MADAIDISIDRITPSKGVVLAGQGIPPGTTVDERTSHLVDEALATFRRLVKPMTILTDVSNDEFSIIYRGEEMNEPTTPLGEIIGESTNLVLFATTIGDGICNEITRLFESNEFAAGAMLDAAASAGTDLAADEIEKEYGALLRSVGKLNNTDAVLRFSPGYCGWHISGQRKLFARLHPEKIGVVLNESYLMQPLKSISGVIAAGPLGIFDIDDTYPFCVDCETHSCRSRYQTLMNERY